MANNLNYVELAWPNEHSVFVEKLLGAKYGVCLSTQSIADLMYGINLVRLWDHWSRLPDRKKPRNATLRIYRDDIKYTNDFEPNGGWLEIRFTRDVFVQKYNLNLPDIDEIFDSSLSSTSRLISCKIFNEPSELEAVSNAYNDIIESEAQRWFALDIAFYFERLG